MCPVERQEGFKSKATERVGRKGTASMCVTKNKTWQHQFNCFFFFYFCHITTRIFIMLHRDRSVMSKCGCL